jgi:hypothetical protein
MAFEDLPTTLVHELVNGALARPQGKAALEIELGVGASLETLLLALGYPREHLHFILAAVNGGQARRSRLLAESSRVTRLTPACGS